MWRRPGYHKDTSACMYVCMYCEYTAQSRLYVSCMPITHTCHRLHSTYCPVHMNVLCMYVYSPTPQPCLSADPAHTTHSLCTLGSHTRHTHHVQWGATHDTLTMYSGEPHRVAAMSPPLRCRANPKSAIFTVISFTGGLFN